MLTLLVSLYLSVNVFRFQLVIIAKIIVLELACRKEVGCFLTSGRFGVGWSHIEEIITLFLPVCEEVVLFWASS